MRLKINQCVKFIEKENKCELDNKRNNRRNKKSFANVICFHFKS